jgi:hypothetical protein
MNLTTETVADLLERLREETQRTGEVPSLGDVEE